MASDAHGDHRAVAAALAAIPTGRRTVRLGYRVWPEQRGFATGAVSLALKGADVGMKRRAVRSYRTQGGKITDAVAGFAMTHRHLRAFAGPQERFAVLA